MNQPVYNDWALVSLSPWPTAWLIAGSLALFAAATLVLWSYRRARRPWLLVVLRAAAALVVLGMLLEPAIQLRLVRRVKNRLAVVVDRSASMALATSDGRTRFAHLQALLERHALLAELAVDHELDWFDLDGPLGGGLADPPRGPTSDLLAALERARDAGAGRPLAAYLLLSDGADNAELETAGGALSANAATRLRQLGAPVNTVAVAGGDPFRDLAIVTVLADEFAFVHNSVTIDVSVQATGFAGLTVPLTLRREGEVLATQEVFLADERPVIAHFTFKPAEIGSFVYAAELPTLAGEAISLNNARAFAIQVVRDKIRVLQVAGRPSWDVRFLRQHLKENPNVDLISFFILRSPTDSPIAPESELALIPFPVDELFTTELKSFDVVIFQNFDHRPYFMAQYLPNIRDAVHGGLGFVMVGGDQSFANAGYLNTPIEEIVPLRLDGGDWTPGPVAPMLTDAGRRHPITDLARGAGTNERLWQRLPGWTALNRTTGLATNATALVVDREQRGLDSQPAPLVATLDVGQGRALAIASDAIWRWRFAAQRDGGAAERAYHRFWSNALHWLVRDPEHSRVRVVPDKRRFVEEEEIDVNVTVLSRDYQPLPAAALRLTLAPTGAGAKRTDDLVTGETGTARLRYRDLPSGAYRVTAQATSGGVAVGTGAAVFVVEPRSAELDRAAPRPALLAALAAKADGRAFSTDDFRPTAVRRIDPEVVEIDQRRNLELWDNAWAMVAVLLLLAADWAYRRRRGYL